MKHCLNCSNELADAAKFCPECGEPVPEPIVVIESKIQEFPPVLTIKEVSKLLKISEWKFYDMLRKGEAPPYFSVGSHKRFITEKVLEWASSQTKEVSHG